MGVDVPYALAFGFHSTKVKNIIYKKCFMFQLRALRLQCLEYLYRICVVYCATHRLAHNTMYNKSIALADVGCGRKHKRIKKSLIYW